MPVSLVALIVACVEPAEPGYDFELETERIIIVGKGREPGPLCAGTADWIDAYVDALAPYYGLPNGLIGKYVWFSDEEYAQSSICGSSGACQGWSDDLPAVFAPQIPIEHELSHVLQSYVSMSCVSMIEEGLAEFLRGPRPTGALSPIDDLVAASFAEESLSPGEYARARSFVSFLVDSYGLQTIIDLCPTVPADSSPDEFDAASLELLGKTLAELLADYADYPECHDSRDRAKIMECSREPDAVVGQGEMVTIPIDASCASPEAVGPKWGSFHISKQVRLLEYGSYNIHLISDENVTDVSVRFERCASCSEDPTLTLVGEFPFSAQPGDYALDLAFPIETDAHVVVEVWGL